MRGAEPEQRGDHDLHDGAGNGDAAYGEQILDREVQADTEHEQDHADLRELRGDVGVGDEAGREGAHGDACQQVPDQGGQAQAGGEQAAEEGQGEADGQGGNEFRVVGHADLRSGVMGRRGLVRELLLQEGHEGALELIPLGGEAGGLGGVADGGREEL